MDLIAALLFAAALLFIALEWAHRTKVALLGAVLMGRGEELLSPFASALVVMGVVAALGGVAAFFGLRGKWKRHEPEPGQVS